MDAVPVWATESTISSKANGGDNEKQSLAVLDHTERSSMEIHGIALQVIFKSRYHGMGGVEYLLLKLITHLAKVGKDKEFGEEML